jgi:hypothetical protein
MGVQVMGVQVMGVQVMGVQVMGVQVMGVRSNGDSAPQQMQRTDVRRGSESRRLPATSRSSFPGCGQAYIAGLRERGVKQMGEAS